MLICWWIWKINQSVANTEWDIDNSKNKPLLSSKSSPLANLTSYTHIMITCFPDSHSRWFLALSGTPSTVSMRTGVSPSECVAPLRPQKKEQVWNRFIEKHKQTANASYLLTHHSDCCVVPLSLSIQENCTAIRACSLSLCSCGQFWLSPSHLSLACQWESIVSLSLPLLLSLLSLPRYFFFFFPAISFCESLTNSLFSLLSLQILPCISFLSHLLKTCLPRCPIHTLILTLLIYFPSYFCFCSIYY